MKIHHVHLPTIDSTNTWCKLHAHEFPKESITLVSADYQTAGRGRFKRRWESPAGLNIYATFCFYLPLGRNDTGNIPQVLALSAANTLREMDFSPELKWPNDILLSNKKVGGILAETTSFPDALCMILGIGLNINMPLNALKSIDKPATSLMLEAGKPYDVKKVLAALQRHFSADLDIFLDKGFSPFLDAYRQAASVGKPIRFHDNQTTWEGILHHIDHTGALVLQLQDSTLKTFIAGEILWPGE